MNPVYTGAYFYNDGLACISTSPLVSGSLKDAKWQYIDKTGKLIISKGADFYSDFYKGMAYVRYDGIMNYIDKTGKIVWKASAGAQ